MASQDECAQREFVRLLSTARMKELRHVKNC